MNNGEMAPLRVVLDRGKGSRQLDSQKRFDLLQALLNRGYSVTCPAGTGEVAPADGSDMLVLRQADEGNGGTPENVHGDGEGFADVAGARGSDSSDGKPATRVKVHFRNVDGADPAAVVAMVDEVQGETETYRNEGWKPWFPVIDYKRCTNCMQCLSFCLFDVYGVDAESQIQVRNPDKCKTNCPACSRVCPEVAILFPKYGSGPINGDEISEADLDREKMKIDISALLGGDIYSLLRDRHEKASSRFSKERDEQKALKERMRCLKKLQEQLDIPPEVLTALPGKDQILAKAREAALATRNRAEGRPDVASVEAGPERADSSNGADES